MENVIVVGVLAVVIGVAARHIYKAKKKGKNCIGCPYCDACSTKENGCCNHQ